MRVKNGAETQNRTGDTRIFSPLLYRLSYLGTLRIGILLLFLKGSSTFILNSRIFCFSGLEYL